MEQKKQQLKGLREFAALYSKSRLGVAWFILLLIFIAIGLLAPVITPYDPQSSMQLANFRAKPEWLEASIPPNIYYVKDSGFTAPNSLEEWQITTSGISVNWFSDEGYPGIAQVEKGSGQGSIKLATINPAGEGIVTLGNTISYNFIPPHRFSAHIAYKVEVVGDASWQAQVILRQTTGTELLLWSSGERT